MKFETLFSETKPVIGMLHLMGDAKMNTLERAIHEIEIYKAEGVDAFLVENYFGTVADCRNVLAWLNENMPDAVYGVNILGDMETAFALANLYNARFIQIDSVCGHLKAGQDAMFEKKLSSLRANSDACVLGGVRFKYQPVRSGRTLEEDLIIGMNRCDCVVVTGAGTGMETPEDKILSFRKTLRDFPIVTGAGVTEDTVKRTLLLSDGVIVGSYFKDNHRDFGEMNQTYVHNFMNAARK